MLGLVFYVLTPKDLEVPELEKHIILTPEEKKELVKKTTSSGPPSLTEEEIEDLEKATSAEPDSGPTLTNDEFQKLLKSMSSY
ncbi:hypothetical protein ACFL3E_00305 [Patescibacteria group bacterium]